MITIAIPFFNLLEETVAVVDQVFKTLNPKEKPFEVLLINNGSQKKIEPLIEKHPFKDYIRIINNDFNTVVSHAWNQALEYAFKNNNSEYLILLNNDIILHQLALSNLIDFANKTNKYSLISGIAFENSKLLEKATPTYFVIEDQPNFACFLMKKSLISSVGLFDEDNFPCYFNDYDYITRMKLENAYCCAYTGSLFYHIESLTSKKEEVNLLYNQSLKNYIKKWKNPPKFESIIRKN